MSQKNICARCPKDIHCCIFKSGGFVFVSPREAENIRKFSKMEFSDFLDFSPFGKRALSDLKSCDPSLEGGLRLRLLDKKNRLLRLKTKRDKRCIFLGARSVCEVYPVRPDVCRIFPFWCVRLEGGGLKVVKHDADSSCALMEKKFSGRFDGVLRPLLCAKDRAHVRMIFRRIERDARDYRKRMKEFVRILMSG